MSIELLYFVRTSIQILPLSILVYVLQDSSRKKLIKISFFFVCTYSLNCFMELHSINPSYIFVVMTVSAVSLISLLFHRNWIDSCIDYSVFLILGFPIGLILEYFIYFLSYFNIKLSLDKNELQLTVYMFLILLLTILLIIFVPLRKLVDKYRSFIRKFYLIIANMFIFYFICKEDYIKNSGGNIIIPLSYLAVIILNIFLFKEFWMEKNRQNMIKQHNEYIKNVEPLISDIRSKQHDFKNHLTTLNNLYSLNDPMDNNISSYISSINKEISQFDYFIYSGNKIIGVILYIKSYECSSKGIDFSYIRPNYEIAFPLKDFEFTSVLGNLIDNAIEAAEAANMLEKKVCVEIGEKEEEKFFEVTNTGNPIPFSNIHKIFSRGYSTKENKKEHGFGLYNVKKIITKYDGKINVINDDSTVKIRISFYTI